MFFSRKCCACSAGDSCQFGDAASEASAISSALVSCAVEELYFLLRLFRRDLPCDIRILEMRLTGSIALLAQSRTPTVAVAKSIVSMLP